MISEKEVEYLSLKSDVLLGGRNKMNKRVFLNLVDIIDNENCSGLVKLLKEMNEKWNNGRS